MKNIIILLLIICFNSIGLKAQSNDSNQKIALESLSIDLCLKILDSAMHGQEKTGDNLERQILHYLSITKETPNYKEIIAKFWNEHSDKFICLYTSMHTPNTPQHLAKRALDLGIHNYYFNRYLFRFKNPKIDFNEIEIVNGEEETIIDYIDKILAREKDNTNYELDSVKNLRNVLVRKFGAKKASEL